MALSKGPGGGPASVNTVEAWKNVAARLDQTIGPLIPNYATVADAEADPMAVGKVVTIGALKRGQKPKTFFIEP